MKYALGEKKIKLAFVCVFQHYLPQNGIFKMLDWRLTGKFQKHMVKKSQKFFFIA